MIILGVDPGTARMGYGFVQTESGGVSLVAFGVLSTPADASPAGRLQMLYRSLSDLVDRYRPDEAAVEQIFFARNARTAIAVGQARGVALLALANGGLSVSEYTPLQVKQAVVGYGRGEKEQVQMMVKMLLGLADVPQPDDAADALAVAICHAHTRRMARLIQRAAE